MALVAQNLDLNNECVTDLEQLRYLSHEIGHVLHFLALPGEEFDEYSLLAPSIGELPSVLLEHIIQDPNLLAKWSDPKGPSGAKKPQYWIRRLEKPCFEVFNSIFDMERAIIDYELGAKSRTNFSPSAMHRSLRSGMKLPKLHPEDRSVFLMFDPTDSAGMTSCYWAGYALSRKVLGKKIDHNMVRKQTQKLLDVLCEPGPGRSKKWQILFGQSLLSITEAGAQELLGDCKKSIARCRKRLTQKSDLIG